MSEATVRCASATAMFGRPMPTKHTRRPASARAPATTSISDLDQPSATRHLPAGRAVVAVVDRPRRGGPRGQLLPACLAELGDVAGLVAGAVDPLVQPGVKAPLVPADRVPFQVEA